MCYELKWLRWKRATETERQREQSRTTTERTPEKRPPEPVKPAVQSDVARKIQKELEQV